MLLDLCSTALAATGDWECGSLNFVATSNCSSSAAPPTAGHSGTWMWGTKLNDCYNPLGNNDGSSSCTSTDTSDDSILQFKVTIPSTWTTATMTYWSWEDLWIPYDFGEIRINGTAIAAGQICSGSYAAPTAWVQRTVDLSAYKGTTATVAFHMMASTVVQYGPGGSSPGGGSCRVGGGPDGPYVELSCPCSSQPPVNPARHISSSVHHMIHRNHGRPPTAWRTISPAAPSDPVLGGRRRTGATGIRSSTKRPSRVGELISGRGSCPVVITNNTRPSPYTSCRPSGASSVGSSQPVSFTLPPVETKTLSGRTAPWTSPCSLSDRRLWATPIAICSDSGIGSGPRATATSCATLSPTA